MRDIKNLRVAAIATDGVEEPELLDPAEALEQAGASVELLSIKSGPVQCFQHHDKGSTVQAAKAIADANPDDYDALLLPGGALNADALRIDTSVKRFVCAFDEEKKPMAVICHAPWILISAGVAKERILQKRRNKPD
jgi:protease I